MTHLLCTEREREKVTDGREIIINGCSLKIAIALHDSLCTNDNIESLD